MSRSRAMIGALTMLTDSRIGASRPFSTQAVSGRVFSSDTNPSYSTDTDFMLEPMTCPARLPICSASFM